MKFNSDPSSVHLRFHLFFHYIGLPLQTVVLAAQLLTLILSRPLQAFSLLYVASRLICTIVCFAGLFNWRPSAWYALCCSYTLRLIEYGVATVISVVNDLGTRVTQAYAQQLVGILIASVVVLYYYYKRRELFFPHAKPLAPATWMEDNSKPESPKTTPKLEASVTTESNPDLKLSKTVITSEVNGTESVSSVPPEQPTTVPPTVAPPIVDSPTVVPSTVAPTVSDLASSPDVDLQSTKVKVHRRPSISIILCIILAIGCIGIGAFSAISINSYQGQLEEKEKLLEVKTEQISELQNANHDLMQQNALMDSQIETANNLLNDLSNVIYIAKLYDESAVYCPVDNSHLYHRANCEILSYVDEYYIYNIELAKYHGYSPCPLCSDSIVEPLYHEYMQYIIQTHLSS